MSTAEDTQSDESTEPEDTRSPEEIATQATADAASGTISRASVYEAYSGDDGFYIEVGNNSVNSTRKLLTLITGYAAALSDELEEPRSMTVVGHMDPRGEPSATAMAELEPYDFEALDESKAAFRKRVVENTERVI